MSHKNFSNMGKGLLMSFVILVLAACGTVTNPTQDTDVSTETINASLETLAQRFAKAVADESVRIQIQQGIAEKFDGDTNILYKTLMANSQSQVIRQSLANAQTGLSSQATLDALTTSIPRLQLAMPAHFDSWDAESYAPLVGYVPADVDDQTLKEIKVFDAEGNLHVLDAQVSPDQPVLLLSQNERTDDDGTLLPLFVPTASGQMTPLTDEAAQLLGQEGSLIEPQAVYDEKIYSLYMRDDNEPWTRGDPELMLKVGAEKATDGGAYGGEFASYNTEDKWYYPNRTLFYWSSTSIGNFLVYFWYERDGGSSVEISVTYKGIGLKFPIQDGDDQMGHALVDISQRLQRTRHDTGDIIWWRYGY